MSDGVTKKQRDELISKGKQIRKYKKRVIFDKWSKLLLKSIIKTKNSKTDTETEVKHKKSDLIRSNKDPKSKLEADNDNYKQTESYENWNPKKNSSSIEKTSNDELNTETTNEQKSQSQKKNKKVVMLRNVSINTHITKYATSFCQTKSQIVRSIDITTQTQKNYLSQSNSTAFSIVNNKIINESSDTTEEESSDDDILNIKEAKEKSHIPTIIRRKNSSTEVENISCSDSNGNEEEDVMPKSILSPDANQIFTSGSDEEINLPPIEIAAPALSNPPSRSQYSVDSPDDSKKPPTYSVDNEYDGFYSQEDSIESDNAPWDLMKQEAINKSNDEIEIDEADKGESLGKTAKVHFAIQSMNDTVSIAPILSAGSSPTGSPLTGSTSAPTIRRMPIIMVRRPTSPQVEISPPPSLNTDFPPDSGLIQNHKNEAKKNSSDEYDKEADVHDSEIPIDMLSDSLSDVDIADLVTPTGENQKPHHNSEDSSGDDIISSDDERLRLTEEPVSPTSSEYSEPSLGDTQMLRTTPLDELLSDIPVTPPKQDSDIRAFVRQFFTAEVFASYQKSRSYGYPMPAVQIPDTARRPFKFTPDYLDLVVDLINEQIAGENFIGMFYEQFLDEIEEILACEPFEVEPFYISRLNKQSDVECDNTGIEIIMRMADSILDSHANYIIGCV